MKYLKFNKHLEFNKHLQVNRAWPGNACLTLNACSISFYELTLLHFTNQQAFLLQHLCPRYLTDTFGL